MAMIHTDLERLRRSMNTMFDIQDSSLQSMLAAIRESRDELRQAFHAIKEGLREDFREFRAGIDQEREVEVDSPKHQFDLQILNPIRSKKPIVDSKIEASPGMRFKFSGVTRLAKHDFPRVVDDIVELAFDGCTGNTQLFFQEGIDVSRSELLCLFDTQLHYSIVGFVVGMERFSGLSQANRVWKPGGTNLGMELDVDNYDLQTVKLAVFKRMKQESNLKPDESMIVSTLSACSALKNLEIGESIHRYVATEFEISVKIGNSLVDMFCKCECHLVETPQSICFMGCHELNQILDLLRCIRCEIHDGTNLVCRAVDSIWGCTRVKEKVDFDHDFSLMLLDKRRLRGDIASFDEGTVDVCDHNVHYAKTHPQGDFITWLLDYPLVDGNFEFPRSIRAHNLDMCVAVLRAIQFTCRTLGTKYTKKLQILGYDAALIDAKNLCIQEDERRMNSPEDQWNIYASLLCDRCEEHLTTDAGISVTTKQFWCAVRDVLEGASHLTFDLPDVEDCLNLISRHKNLSDDKALESIDLLKSVVTNKVLLADSKILLVENSKISLLNDLIRLSVFDHRSDILRLLKRFFREELEEIEDMVTAKEDKNKSRMFIRLVDKNRIWDPGEFFDPTGVTGVLFLQTLRSRFLEWGRFDTVLTVLLKLYA